MRMMHNLFFLQENGQNEWMMLKALLKFYITIPFFEMHDWNYPKILVYEIHITTTKLEVLKWFSWILIHMNVSKIKVKSVRLKDLPFGKSTHKIMQMKK